MSDIKKQVTFTDDVSVKDPDGKVTFSAKAGETVDLVAPSATRWIRRKKAVPGKVNVKAAAPAEDAPAQENKRQAPITSEKPKKSAPKKKAAPKKQAD